MMADDVKVEPIVKQEHVSRENTPFPITSNSLQQTAQQHPSRHNTPRPTTPAPTHETDIPCSQDTVSTAPNPDTPVKLEPLEEDGRLPLTQSPLVQDSLGYTPSNGGASSRRKKKKSRRSGAGNKNFLLDTTTGGPPPPPPVMMNLTHANKHLFDIFQTKQSGASVSTVVTEHRPNHTLPTQRIEQQFDYVKEILSRSLAWTMLPLRWGVHWAAIYLLPFAIALSVLAFVVYLIFPRYIFSAIPSIFATTASIVAFPARLMLVKTPEVWCSVVGLGCTHNTEGEEVVRNATFATDLEVRNAFTVIHNLNYLNNSSNRLVLDSVPPPPPPPPPSLSLHTLL